MATTPTFGPGNLLPFGPAYAPWSETPQERQTGFNAFMANRFGPGTPNFLTRSVQNKFDPYQSMYEFQRGMGAIPATQDFMGYLNGQNNPSAGGAIQGGRGWMQGLIGQGANLFNPGGPQDNQSQAFRDYLANNQGSQLNLAMAHATAGMPAFLQPSMDRVGNASFDKWITGLPQGAAASGVAPSQLNFLNQYQRNGFRF